MERPVKGSNILLDSPRGCWDGRAEHAAVEAAIATVDHSDIRGSEPRIIVIRRELPRTSRAGRAPQALPHSGPNEGSPFRVPLNCPPCCIAISRLVTRQSCASCCFVCTVVPMAHMNPKSSRPTAVTAS